MVTGRERLIDLYNTKVELLKMYSFLVKIKRSMEYINWEEIERKKQELSEEGIERLRLKRLIQKQNKTEVTVLSEEILEKQRGIIKLIKHLEDAKKHNKRKP